LTIQLQKLSLFSAYTCMIVNVQKCCITGALWRSGKALSIANRKLLASRLQNHFVAINSHTSPISSIGPSDTYRVLGAELSTSLTFTKHWHELRSTTTSLINALSTSLLTQSCRIRVIRGLLIGQHSTLQLGLFNDSHLDVLDGHIPTYATSRAQPSTAPRPTSATASPPSKPTPHNSQLVTYTTS
jgi:hypothetical protein